MKDVKVVGQAGQEVAGQVAEEDLAPAGGWERAGLRAWSTWKALRVAAVLAVVVAVVLAVGVVALELDGSVADAETLRLGSLAAVKAAWWLAVLVAAGWLVESVCFWQAARTAPEVPAETQPQ